MTHIEDYEPRALRYADGEMDAPERAVFEEHLRVCRPCAELVEAHRDVLHQLRASLCDTPRSGRIPPGQVSGWVQRRRMRHAFAMACVFSIVVAVLAVVRNERAMEPLQADDSMSAREATEMELRVALLQVRLERLQDGLDQARITGELEDRLAYSESASIAVAAAMHLEESGLDVDGARLQYRYVADRYPESFAAATARERLAAINSATTNILGERT